MEIILFLGEITYNSPPVWKKGKQQAGRKVLLKGEGKENNLKQGIHPQERSNIRPGDGWKPKKEDSWGLWEKKINRERGKRRTGNKRIH